MKKSCYFLFLLMMLFLFSPAEAYSDSTQKEKLIFINLTRIDYSDLTACLYPNIKYLLENGGVGLVSTRVQGKLTPEKVYSAIGSVSSPMAVNTYTTNGLIGLALHQEGKKTAVLGNADLPWQINRAARIMVADDQGEVDQEIAGSEILRFDPQFPFGYCTDYQQLFIQLQRLLPETHLTLIEIGDFERLEGYRSMLSDQRLNLLRKRSLQRLDAFLGKIIEETPEGTNILVFSASPSASQEGINNSFLPLIIYQKKGKPGLLSSISTREKGLLTIGDLTTFILDYLKLLGKKARFSVMIEKGDWRELTEKSDYWLTNLAQRKVILRVYVYLLIGFLTLSTLLPFTSGLKVVCYTKEILPLFAVFPLSLLLIAPFRIENLNLISILLFLITIGIWIFYKKIFKTSLRAYQGLLITTSLVIFFDLLIGSELMRNSLLGPSPALGIRFYGLGNEYLGILLGSFLVGTTAMFTSTAGRKWIGLIMGACSLLIFSPFGGSNFGGGVSAGFASFLVCRKLKDKKEAKYSLFLFFLLLCSGLLIILLKPGFKGKTHIDDAVQLLTAGRWGLLLEIAIRKLQMNLMLINYNLWVKILLLVFILLYIFMKLAGKSQLFTKIKDEWYWPGIAITVDSGLVALLINDSGIIVVGTLLLYPLILLLYILGTQEMKNLFSDLRNCHN